MGTYADFKSYFDAATKKYGLPVGLLPAVAQQESGFNPAARSGAGALGLMQFMPATAAGYGINPLDPVQAIDGAGRYFQHLLGLFGGNQTKAIAAYNAGEGAVQKYNGVPPYAETQNYVQVVTSNEARYGGSGGYVPTSSTADNAGLHLPSIPGLLGVPNLSETGKMATQVAIIATALVAGAGLVLLGVNKMTGNPAGRAASATASTAAQAAPLLAL